MPVNLHITFKSHLPGPLLQEAFPVLRGLTASLSSSGLFLTTVGWGHVDPALVSLGLWAPPQGLHLVFKPPALNKCLMK